MNKDVKYTILFLFYTLASAFLSIALLRLHMSDAQLFYYVKNTGKILGVTSLLSIIVTVLYVLYVLKEYHKNKS